MPANYGKVVSDSEIEIAVEALKENGFEAQVVETRDEAKAAMLRLIPEGSEVLTVTSATLTELGLADLFNSERNDAIRPKLIANASNPEKQKEMKQLASSPDFVTGSVHAITQDGHLIIASASGSQIAPEVYGASRVVFVVGAQKIVKDIGDGLKRIREYSVPLEDARALKAYGIHTSLNKILIFNKERPGRVNIVILKENIGY